METLYLDHLPPKTQKGSVLRLLIEVGGISKLNVGLIELNRTMATVEVADGWAKRLVRELDGAQVETNYIRAWQLAEGGNNPHFAQLLAWLEMEAQAEQMQQVERSSKERSALRRLVLRDEEIGLGERIFAKFSPKNEQAKLPFTGLGVGSPVTVAEEGNEDGSAIARGLISKITAKQVTVALNQTVSAQSETPTYTIALASNEISRQRMQRALTRVSTAGGSRLAQLRDVLLGKTEAEFNKELLPDKVDGFIADLNASQQDAVKQALMAEDVAIIHGPPGTGKTKSVISLIRAAISRGDQVLACAPSNLAVDNLAERLAKHNVPLVRLGHPVRIMPELEAYTLDALVAKESAYKEAQKLRKQAYQLRESSFKFRRARPEKGAKAEMRKEAGDMLREARQIEAAAVERVLEKSKVILSTLTALDSSLLGRRHFDLCVIDEAGQTTEPATWIPIPRVQRLVLAGDHQQLPPTVISQKAAKEGFSVSLLEKLMMRDREKISRRLDVQYRMHEQIMRFSANEFYEGTLAADGSVADHKLSDLAHVSEDAETSSPIIFIDTAGASFDEEQDPDSHSYRNIEEANFIVKKVAQLLDAGVRSNQIAVIAPYSAQVQLLKELLDDAIQVGSVDGFQGREKEALIISLVRSNAEGNVGFLQETRRMNVALTRARRKLIVVGDSATITAHPFFARLLDYMDEIGAYRSVWEEMEF